MRTIPNDDRDRSWRIDCGNVVPRSATEDILNPSPSRTRTIRKMLHPVRNVAFMVMLLQVVVQPGREASGKGEGADMELPDVAEES